jgi:hypothetical protein
MAELVYLLCAITSIGCALLLVRSYGQNKTRLLLWSTLCFVGLALNNSLLFLDLVLVRSIDLSVVRAVAGAGAVSLLLGGLIWSSK